MTTQTLRIAPGLSVPADITTSATVVYGSRGTGKTHLIAVICEEIASTGGRFVYVDPVGASSGLRFSSDGKGRGLEILILGGSSGDIPVTPDSGIACADLVAEERDVNVVIDISRYANGKTWTVEDRVRWVTDFAKHLFHRQGEKKNPRLLILDEASRFAPETIRAGDREIATCRAALEVIAEEGRPNGLGILIAAQRSARLAKSIAELCDCLFAFRVVGPNSLRAILDWCSDNVEGGHHLKQIRDQLRALPKGSCLVISPSWLNFEGIAQIRRRSTYDSSATPTGKDSRASGAGAQIDISKYAHRMAATIERAKADDPRELKRQVAELTEKLRKAQTPAVAPLNTSAIELELSRNQIRDIAEAGLTQQLYLRDIQERVAWLSEFFEALSKTATRPIVAPSAIETPTHRVIEKATGVRHFDNGDYAYVEESRESRPARNHSDIRGGLRRMLTALAQRPQGLSVGQIGVRASISSKSGTFDTYLSRARSNGWIEGSRDLLKITPNGLTALGGYEPLPAGKDLQIYWQRELNGGAARMLTALCDNPRGITAEQLGALANISPNSGTFDTYLSRLRSLELVTGTRNDLRVSEELLG